MKKVLISALTLAISTMALQANASNDRFKAVLEKGKLVVGVKADYKPWGFRNDTGEIVGMEIDMAKDVADKLGVELELVAVQSSNRMQFLEQGKIDLMIATFEFLYHEIRLSLCPIGPYSGRARCVFHWGQVHLKTWHLLVRPNHWLHIHS